MKKPSEEWLRKMADIEDGGCVSVGGLACDLGMIVKIPEEDGTIDPCAVERWIHQGERLPDGEVFVRNIKGLADDWLHYRGCGMDAVASSCRDRLAEIVESIKRIE